MQNRNSLILNIIKLHNDKSCQTHSFILALQYCFIYRSSKIARSILLEVRWSKKDDPDDQGRRGVTISLISHWAQVTRSRRCTFVPACFLRRPTDVISRSDTLRSVSRHDLRKGFILAEIDPRRPIERFCLISYIVFSAFTSNSRKSCLASPMFGFIYCEKRPGVFLIRRGNSAWSFNLHESK